MSSVAKQLNLEAGQRTTPIERYRNIGIMAHIDAGKTTTTERILFYTGVSHKLGEVHDGAAVMDWMVQEQERGITITSARDHLLLVGNDRAASRIPDQHHRHPGPRRFHDRGRARVAGARRGGSGVLCGGWGRAAVGDGVASGGPLPGSTLAFINKMDRPGADFDRVMDQIRGRLKASPVPIQMPIGSEDSFEGVVDLVRMRAVRWDGTGLGAAFDVGEVPASLQGEAARRRERLLEAAAEADDALMERYLDTGELSADEVRRGLRARTLANEVVPVLCGAAFKNKGVQPLLDAVLEYFRRPMKSPRSGERWIRRRRKKSDTPPTTSRSPLSRSRSPPIPTSAP